MLDKHSGCPYCYGNKNKLYNEQWVIDNTPAPSPYISGYKNMSEKCLFHCDKCGQDFYQIPKRLINQHIYGCGCCPTKKLTEQEFREKIDKNFEILSPYINVETRVEFKHITCGTKFKMTPDEMIYRHHGSYCPVCDYKKSKGEVAIYTFLQANNIQFYKEYEFPDLKGRRYDFYLPTENICIEFDGKQHFEPINYFGGEEKFLANQRHDIEKNKYCIQNNIKLFRIPYTDLNNMNFILTKILKEKSSETIEKYLIY